MILQELVSYYERQRGLPESDIAPPGWVRRPLDYVLVIDNDGIPLQIEQLFMLEKSKRVSLHALLPSIGKQALKHTNSGKDANLLWDNASFACGFGDRGQRKLASFIDTIDHWFPSSTDAGVMATHRFASRVLEGQTGELLSLIEKSGVKADFEERDPPIAFRLLSDGPIKIHERVSVRSAYATRATTTNPGAARGRCLVSGRIGVPIAENETVIKGVWRAQPAGANLVSFNAPSFVSYGKAGRQAESAPISIEASSAYSTSLNHMLASKRNRLQVGDASTVFWADRATAFPTLLADLFGEHKDEPDRGVRAVQAMLDAVKTGQLPVAEGDVQFFVLGLAPNASRISVRFWLKAPLRDLAPRILQHFADLRIVRRYDSDPPTPSIFRLLSSLALQGKVDNVPPRLAGEWMRAILEGLPHPAGLLNAAVIRCKAEQDVSYLRATVLKAWLNRDYRHMHAGLPSDFACFKETLDMEQDNVPYQLGRLFAVLERIQQEAQPGINATIRDRYYGAACTTPVTVFSTLLRLKNAHLKKLYEKRVAYFQQLIGEIVKSMFEFPRQLNLPDQGRFALGYYHQRQNFFARKEETPAAATMTPASSTTIVKTTAEEN